MKGDGLKPRFTTTNGIAADLTEIERARGFLEAASLSEEWVERMSKRALLLEAHHTTHIEGTQLTIEQSALLWSGQGVLDANQDDTFPEVSRRSPQRDLKALLDKSLVRESGAGPTDPRRAYLAVEL